MSTALAFQSTVFDVVDHNNQPWIQSSQLALALGYSSEKSITNLYSRNEDEFSNDMSVVINLGTTDIPTKTRIFSLRGCHLIAMFARTKVAKAFRVWVLDVLDKLNSTKQPASSIELTPSTPTDRQPLKDLVDAWVGTSPISYSAAWKQVNAHFSITKITFLPKEWIPDAIAFVQERIDAYALPAATTPALPAGKDDAAILFDMAGRINSEICKFRDTLSPFYREIQDVYGNKIHCEYVSHSPANQARYAAYESAVHALDVILQMAWTAQHSLRCLGSLERALALPSVNSKWAGGQP